MAGDDTITIDLFLFHTEVVASVGHELVVLNEGAGVEQELDSLSGCQLVLSMLFIDSLYTSTEKCLLIDLVPSADEISLGRELGSVGIHQASVSDLVPEFVLEDFHL